MLERTVVESVHAALEVFLATPTLADRLPRQTVHSLERLGRTLVYLEWPTLERKLGAAASCRPIRQP